jgi:Phytanoyl-CoA dioxygenase (PhyH)
MTDPGKMNLLWLDSPFFGDILSQLNESDEDKELIRKFQETGYLQIESGADPAAIDRIVSDPALVYSGKEHETKRALNYWDRHPDVRALATLPNIDRILRLLYRRSPIPMQTINFKVGSEKKAHSDAIQFHSYPAGFMCGVWIALEDIHEQNGPLELYPGSHKLPFYNLMDAGIMAKKATTLYAFYENYELFMERVVEANGCQPKKVLLKKGQALIWASNMLHGGAKIIDKTATRFSQVTHYYFEDCIYYGPLFSDLPLGQLHYWDVIDVRTGQPVKHKYLGEEVPLNPGLFARLRAGIKGKYMKAFPMPE